MKGFNEGSDVRCFTFVRCLCIAAGAGGRRAGAGRPAEGIGTVPARGGGDLDQAGHNGGEW